MKTKSEVGWYCSGDRAPVMIGILWSKQWFFEPVTELQSPFWQRAREFRSKTRLAVLLVSRWLQFR
jgi:hypothetical protein